MTPFGAASVVVLAGCAAAVALLGAVRWGGVRRAEPASREGPGIRRLTAWDRLVHLAVSASFLALAVTGFAAPIAFGERLAGWWLMAHVLCGGVFAVSLAAMVLTWHRDCGFAGHDAAWLRRIGRLLTRGRGGPAGRFDAGQKAFFWLNAAAGTIVIATMGLAMTPLWGPVGIELLREIHRWAALVMVAATFFHLYFQVFGKPGALGALVHGRVSADWARTHHPRWIEAEDEEEPTS